MKRVALLLISILCTTFLYSQNTFNSKRFIEKIVFRDVKRTILTDQKLKSIGQVKLNPDSVLCEPFLPYFHGDLIKDSAFYRFEYAWLKDTSLKILKIPYKLKSPIWLGKKTSNNITDVYELQICEPFFFEKTILCHLVIRRHDNSESYQVMLIYDSTQKLINYKIYRLVS